MDSPKTLTEAVKYFADPDNCLSYMVAHRWPNGVTCPTCGAKDPRFISTRRMWECKQDHPKKQFSVKIGTVFEDSPIPLNKWLPAVWMIVNCKNGISSWELHRALGVTQKTAWFMLHRIRLAMQDEKLGGKLSGDVEVDETYIGGKARSMHLSKRRKKITAPGPRDKVPVMGMLERGGQIRTFVVGTPSQAELQERVRDQVEAGSAIFTDEAGGYKGLDAEYAHQIIDHAVEYVRGSVHTNGLENFWSLLKRGLHGTYVSVEPFHLFRYLDEQSFRYNHRKDMNDADRFSLAISQVVGRRLTYDQLTGKLPDAQTSVN